MDLSFTLNRILPDIPVHPQDYYSGHSSEPPALPGNVLFFSRFSRDELIGTSLSGSLHHRYVLVINGGCPFSAVLDKGIINVERGKSLLIFPFQYHSFLPEQGRGEGDIRALFITFEYGYSEDPGLEALRNRTVTISPSMEREIAPLAEDYLRESDVLATRSLSVRLALFLNEALRAESLSSSSSEIISPILSGKSSLISRLCKTIYDSPGVTPGELARQEGYSTGYLRSLFQENTRRPLGEYILSIRINRARLLLTRTDKSVSRIGEICGYKSLYSFSRMFKSGTGLSPSEFRIKSRGLSPE